MWLTRSRERQAGIWIQPGLQARDPHRKREGRDSEIFSAGCRAVSGDGRIHGVGRSARGPRGKYLRRGIYDGREEVRKEVNVTSFFRQTSRRSISQGAKHEREPCGFTSATNKRMCRR